MRFIPLILVLLLLDLYAFQAVRLSVDSFSSLWKGVVYSLYWLVPVVAIGTVIASASGWTDQWPKNLLVFLRSFLIIFYLAKLLIAAVLVIDDLRRLVFGAIEGIAGDQGFDYGRSRFLSNLGLLVASIPVLTLTYGMIRNPYRYQVHRERVPIKGLPTALNGLKIVQISDIHSGSFTYKDPVANAIELINAEAPDLVFFTGDLVNNEAREMEPYLEMFSKIQAKHGVYSILGNHDYGDYVQWPSLEAKQANMERLYAVHKELGWDLLRNEHRRLTINGEQLAVIGVENYSAQRRFHTYGDLEKAYAGAEDAGLKLLLSHDPTHWLDQVVPAFQDIAITFSGHTHGMQFGIEIPGWIKWSPVKYVYRQWAGIYRQGEQFLYVNRGLGFLGYPGRVGILPEITVLELELSNLK